MTLEYESRERPRKPEPDFDRYRRQAASRCAIASAILGLGGAFLIGAGAVANAMSGLRGDMAQVVGAVTLAFSGFFFIACVVGSTRK